MLITSGPTSFWPLLSPAAKATRQGAEALAKILEIDPLNHFARFEQYLLEPGPGTLNNFKSMIRNELPHETYLEIAVILRQPAAGR